MTYIDDIDISSRGSRKGSLSPSEASTISEGSQNDDDDEVMTRNDIRVAKIRRRRERNALGQTAGAKKTNKIDKMRELGKILADSVGSKAVEDVHLRRKNMMW